MKQVLITGGVRGIGLAAARRFAREGYAVSVCYSRDEESAQAAKKEGFRVIRADVSDEKEVQNLFAECGGVDVLVNNAGVSLVKLLQDTTTEEWNRLFAVNVTGAFLCSRYALQTAMLPRKRGVIVNVSSVWGEVGGSMEVAYSASKAALIGFTKALAKEVGYSGVRVNCVAPGIVETRMNDCFSAETLQGIYADLPVSRGGMPEEIASAIWFLCENEYVTGAVLSVNGGM